MKVKVFVKVSTKKESNEIEDDEVFYDIVIMTSLIMFSTFSSNCPRL